MSIVYWRAGGTCANLKYKRARYVDVCVDDLNCLRKDVDNRRSNWEPCRSLPVCQ